MEHDYIIRQIAYWIEYIKLVAPLVVLGAVTWRVARWN